jgi:hypothetical protein
MQRFAARESEKPGLYSGEQMTDERPTFSINSLQRKWLLAFGVLLAICVMILLWCALVLAALKRIDDGPAHRPSEYTTRRNENATSGR